jgi:hypothetical protein
VILLAIKILFLWGVAAVTVGFGLGFLIGLAERAREDELLNSIFSTLSGKNAAN